jgi:hypothetical protein
VHGVHAGARGRSSSAQPATANEDDTVHPSPGTSTDSIGFETGCGWNGCATTPSVAANCPSVMANTLDVTISHFFSLVLAVNRGLKLPSLAAGFDRRARTSVVLVIMKLSAGTPLPRMLTAHLFVGGRAVVTSSDVPPGCSRCRARRSEVEATDPDAADDAAAGVKFAHEPRRGRSVYAAEQVLGRVVVGHRGDVGGTATP